MRQGAAVRAGAISEAVHGADIILDHDQCETAAIGHLF